MLIKKRLNYKYEFYLVAISNRNSRRAGSPGVLFARTILTAKPRFANRRANVGGKNGARKVSLHESHWILNSPRSSTNAALWLVWNDRRWQTLLLWQITGKLLLLFVAFLGLSTNAISKCDFGWLRLVSNCGFTSFFRHISYVCFGYCSLV